MLGVKGTTKFHTLGNRTGKNAVGLGQRMISSHPMSHAVFGLAKTANNIHNAAALANGLGINNLIKNHSNMDELVYMPTGMLKKGKSYLEKGKSYLEK